MFKIIDNKTTLPSSWKNDALKVELDKNFNRNEQQKEIQIYY